jgi:hypothetical protein
LLASLVPDGASSGACSISSVGKYEVSVIDFRRGTNAAERLRLGVSYQRVKMLTRLNLPNDFPINTIEKVVLFNLLYIQPPISVRD